MFSDFDEIDKEISKTQSGIKLKLNKLRDLENKESIKGFNLKPLSDAEVEAVQDLL